MERDLWRIAPCAAKRPYPAWGRTTVRTGRRGGRPTGRRIRRRAGRAPTSRAGHARRGPTRGSTLGRRRRSGVGRGLGVLRRCTGQRPRGTGRTVRPQGRRSPVGGRGCEEGRPLLADGADENVPARRRQGLTDRFIEQSASAHGHAALACARYGPSPSGRTEHAAHLYKVVSCHADHRRPRGHGAQILLPAIPADRSHLGDGWAAADVQQFTDAEHPPVGHSGTEGRMTGTAPPQGTHPEGEHGTQVMSLGVGTIRTGSGRNLASPDRNVLRKDIRRTEYLLHQWFVIA